MQSADSLNTGAPTPRTSEGEAPAMSIVPALRRYAVSCEGGEPEPAPELAHAAADEIERLRAALTSIAGFGDVNLAGEWEPALRDIIRSMTDCAKRALRESV
jgi:hypothetical protein